MYLIYTHLARILINLVDVGNSEKGHIAREYHRETKGIIWDGNGINYSRNIIYTQFLAICFSSLVPGFSGKLAFFLYCSVPYLSAPSKVRKMKLIEINFNHCRVVQDFLSYLQIGGMNQPYKIIGHNVYMND